MRKFQPKFLVLALGLSAVLIQGCGALNKASNAASASCSLNKGSYNLSTSVPLASSVIGTTGAQYELAQSFTTSNAMTIRSVTLPMAAVGAPNVNALMTLKLQGEVSQIPDGFSSGQALAVVGSVTRNSFTSVKFTFQSDVKLLGSKRYWIRLSSDLPVSGSDYLIWGGALNSVNGGEAKYALVANSWQTLAINSGGTTYFSGATQDLAFVLDCI